MEAVKRFVFATYAPLLAEVRKRPVFTSCGGCETTRFLTEAVKRLVFTTSAALLAEVMKRRVFTTSAALLAEVVKRLVFTTSATAVAQFLRSLLPQPLRRLPDSEVRTKIPTGKDARGRSLGNNAFQASQTGNLNTNRHRCLWANPGE